MGYIISNLELLKGKEIKTVDLVVNDNKISYLKEKIYYKKKLVGDYTNFLMIPTFSTVIEDIKMGQTFEEKSVFYKQLIYQGFTSFVYPITYDLQLDKKITEAKLELLNCPIDYFFALKINLDKLTDQIIRLCKSYKFCGIFVTINSETSIEKTAWGWIKQAYFNYQAPIIPIFQTNCPKEKIKWVKKWKQMIKKEEIITLDELQFNKVLQIEQLCSFGIYPFYANIHQGIPLSYHLIFRENYYGDGIQPDEIVYTFYKGKSIRIFDKIEYYPGMGENISLKVQAFLKQMN